MRREDGQAGPGRFLCGNDTSERRGMPPNGKISREDSSGRLSGRAGDVEHLLTEIQGSPSPESMGTVVLEHVDDYDDEFFEVFAELIARERAHLRLHRVQLLEAIQEYLCYVRRRASEGRIAEMWDELARGAAQEEHAADAADGLPGR